MSAKLILALLVFTFAAPVTYAIDYEVALSYDKSIDVRDLSKMASTAGSASNAEGSIELNSPHKLLQIPWIEIGATEKITDIGQFVLKWRTSLGLQYGKIEAPSGFYFITNNQKINFPEPSSAKNLKFQGNMALEAIRKFDDKISLLGGIGWKYEKEKIEYHLGDWILKEQSSTSTPQLYIGLNYQIANNALLPRLNCRVFHNLKNNVNFKCGVSIPLN
jgi:hypothetical protein